LEGPFCFLSLRKAVNSHDKRRILKGLQEGIQPVRRKGGKDNFKNASFRPSDFPAYYLSFNHVVIHIEDV